jgi:hypothetical protein
MCDREIRAGALDAGLRAPRTDVYVWVVESLTDWLHGPIAVPPMTKEFRDMTRDRLVSGTWQRKGLPLDVAASLLDGLEPDWPTVVSQYANYVPPKNLNEIPWARGEQIERARTLLGFAGHGGLIEGSPPAPTDGPQTR